jgi:hypothetical protein
MIGPLFGNDGGMWRIASLWIGKKSLSICQRMQYVDLRSVNKCIYILYDRASSQHNLSGMLTRDSLHRSAAKSHLGYLSLPDYQPCSIRIHRPNSSAITTHSPLYAYLRSQMVFPSLFISLYPWPRQTAPPHVHDSPDSIVNLQISKPWSFHVMTASPPHSDSQVFVPLR